MRLLGQSFLENRLFQFGYHKIVWRNWLFPNSAIVFGLKKGENDNKGMETN